MSKSFPELNISIAWPVTLMQFYTILSYHLHDYNYSCIKDFSFRVKPIETLILLACLLVSLQRLSALQRLSVHIRYTLNKFSETIRILP